MIKKNSKRISFKEMFSNPGLTQRYSVWLVAITHQSDGLAALDFYEAVMNQVFVDYKVYRSDYLNKENTAVIGENLYFIGKTSVRKRLTTLKNEVYNVFKIVNEDVFSSFKVINFNFFRSIAPFERAFMPGELVASKTRTSEYKGKDIRILDDPENRYLWQNKLIDLFYDEEKEVFKEPDDRSIYWIRDEIGCVGKSKLVKWLCINRPDEAVKIVFGSAQQLRNSVIGVGTRILYLIDIPRSPSKDEKFENMVSSIEEIKNGYVVSHMYGRYNKLMMDPPHVIIFANYKCPRYLLSDDRWITLRINKDLDLIEDIDNNYKLG